MKKLLIVLAAISISAQIFGYNGRVYNETGETLDIKFNLKGADSKHKLKPFETDHWGTSGKMWNSLDVVSLNGLVPGARGKGNVKGNQARGITAHVRYKKYSSREQADRDNAVVRPVYEKRPDAQGNMPTGGSAQTVVVVTGGSQQQVPDYYISVDKLEVIIE